MRSPAITRMYLQVPVTDDVGDWPDDRIWAELQTRLATEDGFALTAERLLAATTARTRGFVINRTWEELQGTTRTGNNR